MSIMDSATSFLSGLAETILVVEDEVFLRCSIGDHLRSCGLHVIETANALEAIRVLSSGTDVDVVFSDVQMPGMVDGVALAHWVSREHPATKIILTSGLPERAWASAAGQYLVLPKPYDHRDLESRIRIMLSNDVRG